jgi:hypothetical protein
MSSNVFRNMERVFYEVSPVSSHVDSLPSQQPAYQVSRRFLVRPQPLYTPKWEVSFWTSSESRSAWTKEMMVVQHYEKVVQRPLEVNNPIMAVGNMKLGELAPLIPEGVLGVHYMDEKPYSLIFKPERASDPRLRLLKDQGWYEVRKHEDTWWSPATLEAFNTLYESGLEFETSVNATKWLEDRTTFPALEFPQDCPLFDYQRDGVAFLSKRNRAMLSLSPGLGKTLTSAYAASLREDVHCVLLVCPASLLYYWQAELGKWADKLAKKPITVIWHKEVTKIQELPAEGEQLWVITNPETAVRYSDLTYTSVSGVNFDLLVVDESIMYKHRESKRSGVIKDIARDIPKVWLLTGAPATRYLDDMWHQLHILNQRGYSSYWRFARMYCIVEETQWATTVVANRRGAEKNLKENLQDIYFARNQEEVADIPDWLFDDIDIAMTPKQQEIYDKLRKDLLIHLEGEPDGGVLKVQSHISLMLRTLQVLSNPVLVGAANTSGKWAALDELMYIYPGPYIVWVNFVRTGELLLSALSSRFQAPESVALVNGSTPMELRNERVEELQAGKLQCIILNSTVGKFGFNLTKARTAFFVERMYDDSYFQCLYRNRRIGTTQSPNIINMRSVTTKGRRTLDHAVHDTLDYRTGMIRTLTIGDIRKALEG